MNRFTPVTSGLLVIIAAVFGLRGNASSFTYPASNLYAPSASLFDVTLGSNGSCSGGHGRYKTTAGVKLTGLPDELW